MLIEVMPLKPADSFQKSQNQNLVESLNDSE